MSTIEPITARPPVSSTNEHAALTFGPIEPAANSLSRERFRSRAADRTLFRRAPALVHGIDVGDDYERVRTQVTGEKRTRQVLVDHRLDADELPAGRRRLVRVHDRDAAAAGADHHAAPFEKPLERLEPEDPLRQR